VLERKRQRESSVTCIASTTSVLCPGRHSTRRSNDGGALVSGCGGAITNSRRCTGPGARERERESLLLVLSMSPAIGHHERRGSLPWNQTHWIGESTMRQIVGIAVVAIGIMAVDVPVADAGSPVLSRTPVNTQGQPRMRHTSATMAQVEGYSCDIHHGSCHHAPAAPCGGQASCGCQSSCCCQPSCCQPSCACQPSCCQPSCCCQPACCDRTRCGVLPIYRFRCRPCGCSCGGCLGGCWGCEGHPGVGHPLDAIPPYDGPGIGDPSPSDKEKRSKLPPPPPPQP
jgi:hypothetical protein